MARNASSTYPFWVAFIKALQVKRISISTDKSTTEDFDRLSEACLDVVVPLWDSIESNYGVTQNSRIERIIELLDLCITANHLAHCKILFTSILRSPGDLVTKYTALYTPLVVRLPQLLRKHNLDIFVHPFGEMMQIFVGQYLHDILGCGPKKGSPINIRTVGCGCKDCNALDTFLLGPTATTLFRLPLPLKNHLIQRLQKVPDLVSYTILTYTRPHGIQITKASEITAMGRWASKVGDARVFLRQVGDEALLAKLMGQRSPDIERALSGAQQFQLPINQPIPSSSLPAAYTTTATAPEPTTISGLKRKATS